MDLGFRSNPNLHRVHLRPIQSADRSTASSGWRRPDFWIADREIDIYVGNRHLERKVIEERAHTQPAACLLSAQGKLQMPAAARKSDLPLSRFPRGKAGAGGFPPRRWHAACQQTALARIGAAAPPARGVSKRSAENPLAHPPDGYHRGRLQMVSLDLRDRAGEELRMAATSALTFTTFS